MSRFGTMPNYTGYNPVGGPYNPGWVLGPQAGFGNQISTAPNSVQQNRYGAFQKNMEKWFPYLGFPSKPIVLDPYDDYSRENFDLPEAYYNTQNYAVSLLLINRILENDAYHVTLMLPWKVWEGGDTISWDEWRFEDHMLTRTPEESVSRLLTSTFSQNKEYIVRYGIAMLLEHGFWNTKKGQTSFDMQVLQMENATVETACHGAQMAVLNVDWSKLPGNMQVTRLKRSADREKRISEEVNNFALLHKEPYGWQVALDKAQQIMRKRVNRPGNFVQWPAGALKFGGTRPEETMQIYGGNGGYKAQPITNGQTFAGARHFESRELRIGEREAPVDPNFREVVIGSWGQLEVPHLKHIPAEQFSYDKANLKIYSESVDKIVDISYEHLLKMSGLFYVPDGNIDASFEGEWQLSVIGKQWFAEHRTWGDYLQSKNGIDHFLKGIVALNDERFATFLEWFVKRAQKDSALSDREKKSLSDQKQGLLAAGGWSRGQTLVPAAFLDEDDDREIDNDAKGMFGVAKDYTSLPDFTTALQKLRTPFADQLLAYANVLARAYPGLPIIANPADPAAALKITARYVDDDDKSLMESITATVRNCLHSEAVTAWDDYKNTATKNAATRDVVRAEAGIFSVAYIGANKRFGLVGSFGNAGTPSGDFVDAPDIKQNIVQIFRNLGMYAANNQSAVPMVAYGAATNAAITADVGAWLSKVQDQTGTAALVNPTTCRMHVGLIYIVAVLNSRYAAYVAATDDAKRLAALQESVVRFNSGSEWGGITAGAGRMDQVRAELNKIHTLPPYQWHLLPVLETWIELLKDISGTGLATTPLTEAKLERAFKKILPSKFYLMSKTPSLGVASRMHLLEKKRRDEVRKLPGLTDATREALMSVWNPTAMDRYKEVFAMIDVLYRNMPGPCEAIFRRRVLTFMLPESKAQLGGVLQGVDQMEMTPAEFVYIMSLFESIYEEEWTEAKGDDNLRQGALDRLALILEELYLTRNVVGGPPGTAPDLWRILKTQYADKWDTTQTVDDFLQGARTPPTTSLVKTIKETQKSLQLRVRSMGSRYFSQLERQLPPSVRRRLEASSAQAESAARWARTDEMDVKGMRDAMQDDENKYQVVPTYSTSVDLSGTHPGGAAGLLTLGGRITTLADEMKEVRRMFGADRLVTTLKQHKISSKLVRFALVHNLPPLLGFGILRPHEIYVMGTMVYMIAGGEAGWTFRGHENFMLQNDAMRKMIFGHFTMYAKSVVFRPEFIVHIQNIMSQEYVGGCGHSFWNPLDKYDRQAYHQGEMVHDCFAFPMDPNERIERTTIDITGRFHPELQGQDEPQANVLHYRAANIQSQVWRWSHPRENPLDSQGFGVNAPLRYNTLCREMLQFKWQHQGNSTGSYSHTTTNKGHWGDRTYAGCGKVRNGESMYLERVPYSGTSTVTVLT